MPCNRGWPTCLASWLQRAAVGVPQLSRPSQAYPSRNHAGQGVSSTAAALEGNDEVEVGGLGAGEVLDSSGSPGAPQTLSSWASKAGRSKLVISVHLQPRHGRDILAPTPLVKMVLDTSSVAGVQALLESVDSLGLTLRWSSWPPAPCL